MRYLFLILFLTGCKLETPVHPEREKLYNYKCQDDKLDALNKQYKICNDSGYLSTACYLQAAISQCEYIGPK